MCGVVYLDQSRRAIDGVVPVRTYPALITAHGRQACEALIARSAGLGAAFQAPASARFMIPVVVLYGLDGLTDVEVLADDDVTGAFVLSAPTVAFEARLARLEADDLAARVQVLERAAGTPGMLTFAAKGDASFATIPDSVQVIELLGRAYGGDGGAGHYARTSGVTPAGADIVTAHGAVFQRVTVSADVVAALLDSGFAQWLLGLPTEIPTQPGKAFNDAGHPAVSR